MSWLTGNTPHSDATTAQKGIVQLSNATNSTSEMLAATPKSVKAASYDLALTGNILLRTLRQHKKELSSSVVQPTAHLKRLPRHRKAVKAANDNANGRVPSARKVNGKALSADITLDAERYWYA